ncbi:hypothetical protein MKEN_00375700 [Mycena kentingensis (nom. inval.)]|nr:hypothetical protein MKEN_00375700 [Mycena kentingensis (nom. inval.)]
MVYICACQNVSEISCRVDLWVPFALLPPPRPGMPPMTTFDIACALAATVVVLYGWQKLCKRTPIWVRQLDHLGVPRARDKPLVPGTVVVCGGSVAGILSARVCADHFERVLVVDPDIENPGKRIIQWNAAHLYLCLFVTGVRRLWRNFDEVAKSFGGRILPADLQFHYSGVQILGPHADYPNGDFPDTLLLRRASVQKSLYQLLRETKTRGKIEFLSGTVRSFKASADQSAIESITFRNSDGALETLNDVALFIDCSGKSQAGFKWLRAAGYDIPDHIKCSYDPNMRYMTCTFLVTSDLVDRLPIPQAQKETPVAYAYFPHDDTQSCFLGLSINDGNAVQILFGDTGMGHLPGSADELLPFLERYQGFAKPLPSWLFDTVRLLVQECVPEFDPINLNLLAFIQYHLLRPGALPSNFVAVGDASVYLNPVHGQGFAKAMLNCITLNALLHADSSARIPRDFSARYFNHSAKMMKGLWDATKLQDYGSTSCIPAIGETKETGRIARWVTARLITASTKDSEIASTLWHVRQMLAADAALFAPTVLWKVIWTPSMF